MGPLEEKFNFNSDLASFNETVTDVSDSTRDFFFKRHQKYTRNRMILIVLLAILCLFLLPPVALLLILIPIIAYWRVHKKMKHLFFTQIAEILGMHYEPSSDRTTVSGYFFTVGRGSTPTNILVGTYEGVPIRLYEYHFITGHGKHKENHPFVVSEIDTQGNLPHVFMKPDNFSDFNKKPPGTRLLSLEGGFNNHFDVYVPEDSEINALRILEPDVMAKLIDEFLTFGFECFGTKTYVFTRGSFADNRESLLKHIKLLERLYDELIPELKGVVRSQ